MFETVSVDEALRRGKRIINFPIIFFIFFPFLGSIWLFGNYQLSAWIMLVGFISGCSLGWIYWSFSITWWRLWAFENVRNVHELKKRAIKEKLIWPDGSFWEKTEIRTSAQKEKWIILQSKFKITDQFQDDYNVKSHTEICYSKTFAIVHLIGGLAALAGSAWLISGPDNKIFGVILAVVGAVYIVIGIKRYNNRKAQIILSNEGIATADEAFCGWNDVRNEDTKVVRSGKSHINYLTYSVRGRRVDVKIDALDTSKRKIEDLLRLYRARYEQRRLSKSKNAALDKLLG